MFSDFLNLIFPEVCLLCERHLHKSERILCAKCVEGLPTTDNHLEYNYDIAKRLMGRMSCKYVLAFLFYRKKGIVQELIHELKYRNQEEVGAVLGYIYGEMLSEAKISNQFDLIIPVPLHPKREKKRGYNQSDVFAEALARAMKVEYRNDLIKRTINTQTQTRKSRIHRWVNVEEVFEIAQEEDLSGQNILIVDDILTTGATFEAMGAVVRKYNPSTISVLAMAVAV